MGVGCMKEISLSQLMGICEKLGVNPKIRYFVLQLLRRRYRKLYGMFTNGIHGEVFKRMHKKAFAIAIAKNYCVLTYKIIRKYKKWFGEWETTESMHDYIIGINSDGKYFINKPRTLLNLSDYSFECKDTLVAFIDDNTVHELLGYHYDLESSNVRSIPVSNSTLATYRMQGDLLMTVLARGEEAFRIYSNRVRSRLQTELTVLVNMIILRRIRQLLGEYGLTVEGNRCWCLPRRLSYVEMRKYLALVSELIQSELYVSDLGVGAVTSERKLNYSVLLYYMRDSEETMRLEISIGQGHFGYPFLPITFNITIFEHTVLQFVEEIMNDLQLEEEKIVHRMGRHMIEFTGYPDRLIIECDLPFSTLTVDNHHYVFTLNLGLYLITGNTLKISHPEHGTIEYSVNEPITAEFSTIQLEEAFIDRMNYHALKQLKERKA